MSPYFNNLQDAALRREMSFNSLKYSAYSECPLCIVSQEIASNSKRNSHQNSHHKIPYANVARSSRRLQAGIGADAMRLLHVVLLPTFAHMPLQSISDFATL
jgi:hypothetical protein